MEFSTIGAEDALDEAKARLQSVAALIVWGKESILGVMTEDHLGGEGSCGGMCELDVLVDASPEKVAKWRPAFIIITEDGEPVLLNRGP